MKSYAISDMHGCADTFLALLDKIGLNQNDHLYLLGDYVDRGPKSKSLVKMIMRLQKKGYSIFPIRGNHEEQILDFMAIEDWVEGPRETLESFGIKHFKELPQKYKDWLSALPYYIETDRFIFVHAGLYFRAHNPLADRYAMMWIRNWYQSINYEWLGDRIIVHGHTPINKQNIKKMCAKVEQNRVVNIDNACVFKNRRDYGALCCLDLDNMQAVFKKNIDKYR